MAYNPQLYQNVPTMNGSSVYPNTQMIPNVNPYSAMPNMAYSNLNLPQALPTAAYIQSEIEASSYAVGAGNTVVLIDSNTIDTENPVIYIKTTGYDGKPLRFKKITGTVSYPNEQGLFTPTLTEVVQPELDLSNYAEKSDLEGLKTEFNGIVERLNSLDESLSSMTDSISNIDNRFSNMFNAVSGNNNSNNNPNNRNNHNNNSNRKGN